MADNNNNNNNDAGPSHSAGKRKADGTDPSPRGKKLGTDLLATLEDPDLCDVTLVGSDGGRVPAVRVFLSARSEILKHLFNGQFREATEEEVRMDYPAAVLKAIVHFCCTDDISDLRALDADILESTRLAIKLFDAADYYGLDLLKTKVLVAVHKLINSEIIWWGRCMCCAFEEASQKPSLRAICHGLYNNIVSSPGVLTTRGRPGVTLLSSTNLCALVEEPALRARASLLYQAIKVWFDNSSPVDEETFGSDEDRRTFAKQLATNLELRMMTPNSLVGPVRHSGLVEPENIIQALEIQSRLGMLGIYGCIVGDGPPAADRLEVNGVYEEIPVKSNFEVVAGDHPTRVLHQRRFEKRGKPGTGELNLTIISYFKGTGAQRQQCFKLLAPPTGAGNLVLTSTDYDVLTVEKIEKDNRLLYFGHRLANKNAKSDGTDVKWECTNNTYDLVRRTKNLPMLIIGSTLLSAPSVSPTWPS